MREMLVPTHRDSAATAGAVPVLGIEVRPFSPERLQRRRRRVQKRETGEVDSAVAEVIQVQLVHYLDTGNIHTPAHTCIYTWASMTCLHEFLTRGWLSK